MVSVHSNMASESLTIEQVLSCLYSNYGLAPPQINPRALDFPDMVKTVCLSRFHSAEKRRQKQVVTFLKRNCAKINKNLGFTEDTEVVSATSSKSEQLMNAIECLDVPGDLAQQSHHDPSSGFGYLCLQMNMKNIKSNRLLLKRRWQRSNCKKYECGKNVEISSLQIPNSNCESVVPFQSLHSSGSLLVSSGVDDIQEYLNKQIPFCPSVSPVGGWSQIPSSIVRLFKTNAIADMALPSGVVNVGRKCESEERPNLSFKCSFNEGSFLLSPDEWNDIYRDGRLVDYTLTLRRKFASVNNICLINFKSVRYNKKSIVISAYCAHYGCKTFTVTIQRTAYDDVSVFVCSSAMHFNHSVKKTLYLKGVERTLVQNELQQLKPAEYRRQTIINASPVLIKLGNYQNIKSPEVTRRARSEALSRHDNHKDEIFDIMLLMRIDSSYIKCAGQPFFVHMYSLEQLEICKQVQKTESLTLHIDATGGVVRPPPTAEKRVLYYAGVIRVRKINSVIPILEMISTCHDSYSIGNWLLNFKSFCAKQKIRWPLFPQVVTDFSFAIINAVVSNWLGYRNLVDYLNTCFDYLFGHNSKIALSSTLHICCSHFMKIIANDVNKSCKTKVEKRFFKEVLGSVFNICTIEAFIHWHYNFFTVTHSIYKSVVVEKAIMSLYETNSAWLDEDDYNSEYLKMGSTYETIYQSSNFYRYFVDEGDKIMKQIKLHENNEMEFIENNFYNTHLYDTVLKKYIAYLPLWSGLLLNRNEGEYEERKSNATVENWFGQIKNSILDGNKNLRVNLLSLVHAGQF